MPKIAKNRKSRKSAMKKSAKNKLSLRRSAKKMKRKSRRGGSGAEAGIPPAPKAITLSPATGPRVRPRTNEEINELITNRDQAQTRRRGLTPRRMPLTTRRH